MSEPFRLGGPLPPGRVTCDYGLKGPVCNKPSTTHVMWLESSMISGTCAEHLAEITERAEMAHETHPFEGDCGMPGVLWHHPYEDEEHGYCVFPGPDDASAMVRMSVPCVQTMARRVSR